jgi:hypothetical protein
MPSMKIIQLPSEAHTNIKEAINKKYKWMS